jgi:hypothetical protein
MTMSEPAREPDFAVLYRRAFEEFGGAALWSSKPVAAAPDRKRHNNFFTMRSISANSFLS